VYRRCSWKRGGSGPVHAAHARGCIPRNGPSTSLGREPRRPSPLVSTPPSERPPHPIGRSAQAMSRGRQRAQRSNAGQADPRSQRAASCDISVHCNQSVRHARGGGRGAPRRQRHPHRCHAGGGCAGPLAGAATCYGRGHSPRRLSSFRLLHRRGPPPPAPPAASPKGPSPGQRPPTAGGAGLETGDRRPGRCACPPHAAPRRTATRRAAPSHGRGRAEAARGGGGGGGGGQQTPRGAAPATRGRDRQTAAAVGGGGGGVRLRGMHASLVTGRWPASAAASAAPAAAPERRCQAIVCGASRGRQISCALSLNRPSNWMVHGAPNVPLAQERQQGGLAPGPGCAVVLIVCSRANALFL